MPKSMEGVIESHPFVDAALIAAQGKPGLALLVEPQTAVMYKVHKQKLLDDIWPSVQSAIEICPVKERIQKDWWPLTGSMPGAAKGYPRRKTVYELYEKDIGGLYRKEGLRTKIPEESKHARGDSRGRSRCANYRKLKLE